MTALTRFLAPALAAALVGACGVSSVSGPSSDKSQLASPAVQPAAAGGGGSAAEKPVALREQEAVRKVALSVTSVSDPRSKSYKIGPLDVLEVTVFKVPDLSKTIQVSDSGTINFPLIGEIEAEGKTAREVEQLLTAALGTKYLQNPQITVFVKEYNSQRVTIEGAVKKPGVFPMAGGMSLLQAIAQAQGLTDTAEFDGRSVPDGKRETVRGEIRYI